MTNSPMRWFAEVKDVVGIRLIGDLLEDLSMTLLDENGEHFIVSELFEALETAADVRKLAERAQSIIAEAAEGDSEIECGFRLRTVIFEQAQDGSRKKHAFATGAAIMGGRATMHAVGRVTGSTQALSAEELRRIEEERQEREYQRVRKRAALQIVSAFKDDRSRQVQRFLRGELTPQTLGHVADLIQADLGAAMSVWISGNQLTRFYRSINHPSVFGDSARHIVSSVEPPPKPMSLDEARQVIRELAIQWLKYKAGLNNGD